jgi:hypothetical protein
MKDKETKEIARIELNIDSWPIFTTYKRGGKQRSREIVRYKKIGDKVVQQRVIIRSVDKYGTLVAPDFKMVSFVGQKLLEIGSKDGDMNFTLLGLIREYLGIENPSSKHYDAVVNSLMRCRTVPIEFDNCFLAKDGSIITIKEPITIFSELKIFERKKDIKEKQEYFGFCRLKLHPLIWQSIKNKYIRPIRFDVLRTLKSDVSILLYKHLDRMLYKKTEWSKDIIELAEEIGITERRPRRIRLLLLKACDELKGKELTHGRITYIEVKQSKEKSGWKLVVRKGRHIKSIDDDTQTTDECEYWLNVYNGLSEQEKAEVDRYVEEQIKNLSGTPGSKYIGSSEFLRESLIIEYLQNKLSR